LLLKKAFASYLPENVLKHPKQGFGIPIGAWFRGPLYGWVRELLTDSVDGLSRWFDKSVMENLLTEHLAGRANHGKRIYALAMLALWRQGNHV
jgi:asparagine synthase (glutamine-hydrolysing)